MAIPVRLTPMERAVLCLFASAESYEEMATRLWVSVPTMKTHARSLFSKLGARSRAVALGKALVAGVICVTDLQNPPLPNQISSPRMRRSA
jgi:two-component system NarL family response regulator